MGLWKLQCWQSYQVVLMKTNSPFSARQALQPLLELRRQKKRWFWLR